jgi:site-specific recombinase XerD
VAVPDSTFSSLNRSSSDITLPISTESSANETSTKKVKVTRDVLFGPNVALVSPEAQAVIRKALAESTTKSYLSLLQQFQEFCQSQNVSLLEATDVHFVNYAQKFASPQYSFSMIRVLFSAAKYLYESHHPGKSLITPLIQKFLKGAARICKVPKRSLFVWDPQLVLDAIEKRDRPTKINRLASEAAVLLALASAIRSSDLNRLSHKVEVFDVKRREVFVPFIECQKAQNRPGIIISQYENARSCPVVAIMKYIEATKSIRVDEFLFLSSHSGTRCKPPTVKRWLLEELALAGVAGATPGSTRSAAASSAFASNMSFDAIAGLAGWRREHTFQKHYRRKILPRATSLLPKPIEPIEPDSDGFIFDLNVAEDSEFGSDE